MEDKVDILNQFEQARVKITYKQKPRGMKMKINIKLNQQESSTYQQLVKTIKPPEMDMATFERGLFFMGLDTMYKLANKTAEDLMTKSPEEVDAILKEMEEPTKAE